MTDRTIPTQVEIADLIMLLSYYEGREGTVLTSEDRDGEAYLHAQNAADAILTLLADQPTVAEAWLEGFRTGKSRAMRYMSDEPRVSLDVPNPYLAAGGESR